MRGLGLGALVGLTWVGLVTLASGLAVLPGACLTLLPPCLVGGLVGQRLPSAWLAQLPRGAALGGVVSLVAVWSAGFLAFRFLLTHSFDLLDEIAALFATAVVGAGTAGALAAALAVRLLPGPSGRGAAMLPGAVALMLGLVATLVTASIVGFQLVTLALAVAAASVATVALRTGAPALTERGTGASVIAAAGVLALAGGVAGYAGVDSARAAAWQDSQLVRSLASALVSTLDVDGDGIPGGLGHGDCDDADPRVFPGNGDTPGDGRDTDCSGADASVEAVKALWTTDQGARHGVAAPHPFPRKRWNLIVVTLDAVRADHLSLYGYGRPTAPNLEMLARISVVFERAWSASNYTASSLFSLFTGLYPSAFLAGTQVASVPGLTLTEQLAAAGWTTQAIVDLHPLLQHVAAGFALVDDSLGSRAAKAVRNRSSGSTAKELTTLAISAVDRLAARDEPFFLWTHYSEPHAGYLPHAAYAWGSDDVALYDGEIAFADAAIGDLLAHLQRTGRLEDTIVLVTSDHGEAFGEHGVFTHGQSLFEEEVHVPLILYLPAPGGKGYRTSRLAAPVDLTDVVPTLLDAVGLAPARPVHGESLLAHVLVDAPLRTPETFSEVRLPYARLQAVRLGSRKIIADHLVGVVRRFDLATDPHEEEPVVGDPSDLRTLRAWTDLHLAFPRIGPPR